MNIQIALSPNLNMTPDEFARAWNASEKHRAAATARTPEGVAKSYDPALAQQLLLDLTLGVMGGVIVELVEELFVQEGVKKRIKTTEITRPDGTHIVVVEQEEG